MTLFANHPTLLSLILVIPLGGLMLLPARRPGTPLPSQSELPRTPSPSHAINIVSGPSPPPNSSLPSRIHIIPLPALTIYRSHMMLMTILAILAVDFPVFPRSLAKCETFGVSLVRSICYVFIHIDTEFHRWIWESARLCSRKESSRPYLFWRTQLTWRALYPQNSSQQSKRWFLCFFSA